MWSDGERFVTVNFGKRRFEIFKLVGIVKGLSLTSRGFNLFR